MEFKAFPKIPRLNREIIITEKIDGTNALIYIMAMNDEDGSLAQCDFREEYGLAYQRGFVLYAGSRKRWITPENDNFGFAKWIKENAKELFQLGPGYHYGEWWGKGIQRGYGLDHRVFSLFNVSRWGVDEDLPMCCDTVPILAKLNGFDDYSIEEVLLELKECGSYAAPGYMNPEGIVICHKAANQLFKVTLEDDNKPKGEVISLLP